jgi:hypothetical protein
MFRDTLEAEGLIEMSGTDTFFLTTPTRIQSVSDLKLISIERRRSQMAEALDDI